MTKKIDLSNIPLQPQWQPIPQNLREFEETDTHDAHEELVEAGFGHSEDWIEKLEKIKGEKK